MIKTISALTAILLSMSAFAATSYCPAVSQLSYTDGSWTAKTDLGTWTSSNPNNIKHLSHFESATTYQPYSQSSQPTQFGSITCHYYDNNDKQLVSLFSPQHSVSNPYTVKLTAAGGNWSLLNEPGEPNIAGCGLLSDNVNQCPFDWS